MNEDTRRRGPFAIESIDWEPWSEPGTRFGGKVRMLSSTRSGGMKIGVAIEELAPGKQSCPLHYHLVEEEHMMILEGTATLHLGDERIPVKAGDFVSFPAARPEGHCLVNEGDAPCRYLVIGDHSPDEVCVYPDSNKIMVRALNKAGIADDVFDASATRDYYDGEGKD
jgi:uncharacterized cupin superfamily protein